VAATVKLSNRAAASSVVIVKNMTHACATLLSTSGHQRQQLRTLRGTCRDGLLSDLQLNDVRPVPQNKVSRLKVSPGRNKSAGGDLTAIRYDSSRGEYIFAKA